MSITELETKAREIRELRRMKEELEEEITNLEDKVKAEMTARNVDEMVAGEYRIKWTSFQTKRFDTAAFKRDHAFIAANYTVTVESRRFSIN